MTSARLIIARREATNSLYAWTGHGNGTTTYQVDGLNRLISQISGQATTAFSHDARSNRLNDGARTYVYDSENKARGTATAPWHYDPLGRLSGVSTSPGTPPTLAYENYIDRLVAERTPGTLTPQRRHVFGPGVDEPIVWYEGSDRRFLQADERGSIVAVSDGSAAVQNVNRYDEYGRTQNTNNWWLSRFGFTGQRYFSGHGIYHFKNRMYDEGGGRFMQPDPIGYDDGANLYAYVGGDPVNFTDPWGLKKRNKPDIPPKRDGSGGGGGSGQTITVTASRADQALRDTLVMLNRIDTMQALNSRQGTNEESNDVGDIVVTGRRPAADEDEAPPLLYYAAADGEHTKGKRPSVKGKHEKGAARKARDRGNEKGDARRRPPRVRPKGWKGKWPPAKGWFPLIVPDFILDPCGPLAPPWWRNPDCSGVV